VTVVFHTSEVVVAHVDGRNAKSASRRKNPATSRAECSHDLLGAELARRFGRTAYLAESHCDSQLGCRA
jgi:hypothetical protein